MSNENVIEILNKLISCKSITPEDDGCQEFIELYLKNLGFETEIKKHDNVINLIARYGKESPVFAYAGMTALLCNFFILIFIYILPVIIFVIPRHCAYICLF